MTIAVPIDPRSDTVTRPTDAMRAAMAAAVGDDPQGEEPTTNRLGRKDAFTADEMRTARWRADAACC